MNDNEAAAVAARLAAASNLHSSTCAPAAAAMGLGLQRNNSSNNSSSYRGMQVAADGAAEAGDFDPGLRLRVKALRGPLEDAMRCYSEVMHVSSNY